MSGEQEFLRENLEIRGLLLWAGVERGSLESPSDLMGLDRSRSDDLESHSFPLNGKRRPRKRTIV